MREVNQQLLRAHQIDDYVFKRTETELAAVVHHESTNVGREFALRLAANKYYATIKGQLSLEDRILTQPSVPAPTLGGRAERIGNLPDFGISEIAWLPKRLSDENAGQLLSNSPRQVILTTADSQLIKARFCRLSHDAQMDMENAQKDPVVARVLLALDRALDGDKSMPRKDRPDGLLVLNFAESSKIVPYPNLSEDSVPVRVAKK